MSQQCDRAQADVWHTIYLLAMNNKVLSARSVQIRKFSFMREISKNAEHNLLSSVLLRQTSQQKLKTQTGKSLLFLIFCPVCVYLRRYYVTICAVAQMCFALTYALNENGFCVFFVFIFHLRCFFQPLYYCTLRCNGGLS